MSDRSQPDPFRRNTLLGHSPTRASSSIINLDQTVDQSVGSFSGFDIDTSLQIQETTYLQACALCRQQINTISLSTLLSFTKCFMCRTPAHTSCVATACQSTIINDDVVQAIAEFKCPLIYACEACRRFPISSARDVNNTTIASAVNEAISTQIQPQFDALNAILSQILEKTAMPPSNATQDVSAVVASVVDDVLNAKFKPQFAALHKKIQFVIDRPPAVVAEISSASVEERTPSETTSEIRKVSHIGQPVGAGGATKKVPKTTQSNRTKPASSAATTTQPTTLNPPSNSPKPKRSRQNQSKNSTAQSAAGQGSKPTSISKPALEKAIMMSYAQILSSTGEQRERTIHMKVIGAPDKQLIGRIRQDPALAQHPPTKFDTKDDNFISIQFQTKTDAFTALPLLSNNFPNNVQFAMASPVVPQIKLINLPNEVDAGTLKQELFSQNDFLSSAEFSVSRVYSITTDKRVYSNAILDCSLSTQSLILSAQSLMYAGRKRYVHEFVNVLQCTNCLAFGHLHTQCTKQVACRKCAESHLVSNCTSNHLSCLNCISHNKSSQQKFFTDHLATSDICQSRLKRINGLKAFFSSSKN